MSNKMIPVVSPESINDGIVRKPIMQFDAEFLVSMFDEFAHKKYNHGFDYWIETLTTEDKIEIITKGENLSDSTIAFIEWNKEQVRMDSIRMETQCVNEADPEMYADQESKQNLFSDEKYIQECAEFITTKWVGFVPSTKNKIRKDNVN